MAERFFISRLSSLGDVVCSLPAAGALKKAFPECEVVWAVDPRFSGVVKSCRHVDEVLELKPKFSPSTWPKIEGEFDAALDLQGLSKSAIVLKGVKAKTKVGYHWQREGAWLFSERVIPDPSSLHVVDQYVDVARAVGGEADFADFGLEPLPEALDSVKQKLGMESPFVVLNGGAGWPTKRWPPYHFGKLIDLLEAEGFRSVLMGFGKADEEVGAAIEAHAQTSPIKLIGKTSVQEMVAVLSLAKAHIGGDTGSSHLAAGLGIPAVGLYSITKPVRSCPYGQFSRCHYHPDTLASIQPAEVFETLKEALKP